MSDAPHSDLQQPRGAEKPTRVRSLVLAATMSTGFTSLFGFRLGVELMEVPAR